MYDKKYLEMLGYSPNMKQTPSPEQLKKRWRELCKKHHPDHGGDTEAFLQVTHAYQMLVDPSYAREQNKKINNCDLDINFNFVVEFEDAFSGKPCLINYSIIEFDGKGMPLNSGSDLRMESIRFDLRPGRFNPYTIEFIGKGYANSYANETQRGDVNVHIHVKKHPKFQFKETVYGADIHSREEVELDKMLCGGSFTVETMRGPRDIKIPPGTTPGTEFRINHCGVNGSHVAVVFPRYPSKAELKSAKYKGMNIKWEEPKEEEDNFDIAEKLRNLKRSQA